MTDRVDSPRRPLLVAALTAAGLIAAPFVLPWLGAAPNTVNRILVWGLFGIGFDILFGYTGLLSFGQSAVYGTGGFVAAYLLTRAGFPHVVTALLIALVLLVGAAVGTWRARRVEMTQMPELIAILHSFVGAAAVLVGFNSYLTAHAAGADDVAHLVEVSLGVLVGAVTFTGSVVAFLKLSGRTRSAPLQLPGRNLLNLAALLVSLGLVVWFVVAPSMMMRP